MSLTPPSCSSRASELATGLADPPASVAGQPDRALLVEEVKVGCTQGMLLCLDRDHRVAYVLGEVFELSSTDAAAVLDLSSTAYRKRLLRAREKVREFMRGHCGIINPNRPCRCERRITYAIEAGRVNPAALESARRPPLRQRVPDVELQVGEMQDLQRIAGIFQSHPDYAAPDRVLAGIRRILDEGSYSLLQ